MDPFASKEPCLLGPLAIATVCGDGGETVQSVAAKQGSRFVSPNKGKGVMSFEYQIQDPSGLLD
jgi:hypothetical protein